MSRDILRRPALPDVRSELTLTETPARTDVPHGVSLFDALRLYHCASEEMEVLRAGHRLVEVVEHLERVRRRLRCPMAEKVR